MEFWLECQWSLFRLSWVALHEVLWWFVCVITWVVMSLVFRAHKKRWSLFFFRSSGNRVVTTVIVSGWYCGKSALPACDDLTLREIRAAMYLFCRDLLWSPPTHPPPPLIPLPHPSPYKKNEEWWVCEFCYVKLKNPVSSFADVPMLENVKCSVQHVACRM